jgi:choline kinase
MKVILIGAGRGQRLMPLTEHQPKTFTTIAGKRIIDWTLEAFRSNGLDDFVFIGGYAIDAVRESLPDLEIVENRDWADNNILFSLLHAREYMAGGFYATYTDTLFRPDAVAALRASPHDITLVTDTRWRERYRFRSQHPEADGEKLTAVDGRVTGISRHIDSAEASGEFTGVMRMTARGARQFLDYFDELHERHGGHGLFSDGRPFRMSYLIHQLDSMVSAGIEVHCVGVPGQYHEIDTLEDYDLARQDWTLSGSA